MLFNFSTICSAPTDPLSNSFKKASLTVDQAKELGSSSESYHIAESPLNFDLKRYFLSIGSVILTRSNNSSRSFINCFADSTLSPLNDGRSDSASILTDDSAALSQL